MMTSSSIVLRNVSSPSPIEVLTSYYFITYSNQSSGKKYESEMFFFK